MICLFFILKDIIGKYLFFENNAYLKRAMVLIVPRDPIKASMKLEQVNY